MVAWHTHAARSKLCASGTVWSSAGLHYIALISGSSAALLFGPVAVRGIG
jgi:hypothetical protein